MREVKTIWLKVFMIALIGALFLCNCAFATTDLFGEYWQINPQKKTVVGSGSNATGYGQLPNSIYNVYFSGGVRAEYTNDEGAFTGRAKINLIDKSSPSRPIATTSIPANFPFHAKGYTYPAKPYYLRLDNAGTISLYSSKYYKYQAVSTSIPNDVTIYYLFYLCTGLG